MPVPSFRMPFPRVPITFWLPIWGEQDEFGNSTPTYSDDNTFTVQGCYVPGDTDNAIENGAPYRDEVLFTLYLPETVSVDLRSARCRIQAEDAWIANMTFLVRGVPSSYMRAATPGDMSTVVKLVEYVG